MPNPMIEGAGFRAAVGLPALALALALAACSVAHASELSGSARKEVDHLLSVIGSSRCEFYRAGTWHSPAAAQSHLEHKYQYLLTRQMLSSAEDFIAKAATRSSMTGEAYAIRCPQMPAQPSATWLEAELRTLRSRRATTTPGK